MTAGTGSHWTYRPAFQIGIVGAASLATPAGFSGINTSGGTVPAGASWSYKVVACIDGVGALRSASSVGFTFVHGGTIGSNLIAWTAVPGARCYRVYRNTGGFSLWYLFDIAYTNAVVDFGLESKFTSVPALGLVGLTAQSSYTVDLAPATYNPLDDRWLRRSTAKIDGVLYEDLSDVEGLQSFRRELMAKEFGVRVSVNMTFTVEGGSKEEDDLIAVYGAKLGFPDGPASIGAIVYFSLASGRSTQGYKPVRILGNFSRAPSIGGKNAVNIFSWRIIAVKPLPVVPNMVDTSGKCLW